jgi:hypothetical protein
MMNVVHRDTTSHDGLPIGLRSNPVNPHPFFLLCGAEQASETRPVTTHQGPSIGEYFGQGEVNYWSVDLCHATYCLCCASVEG